MLLCYDHFELFWGNRHKIKNNFAFCILANYFGYSKNISLKKLDNLTHLFFQILAGNFGLSYEEAKAQFALWAIMASPLLLSNDLRSLDTIYKELLTNKEIIAVNQDPLGIMGKRVYNVSPINNYLMICV